MRFAFVQVATQPEADSALGRVKGGEPFAEVARQLSQEPVSARKVMELLRDLNRTDGLTVVVTLHQVDYALRYCDRILALKAGALVYDGPPSGLKKKQLIEIYGPEFEDVFWEGAPQ